LNILVIDAETYYSTKTGYTLSKMTTAEYVQSPEFQLIGLAYSLDGVMSPWYPGETGIPHLRALDLSDTILVAHNAVFDGYALSHQYDLKPKAVACTMSLARAAGWHLIPKTDVTLPKVKVGGASLAALADAMRDAGYRIPAKGDEVIYADGKRLEDFSRVDLNKYGAYCQDDVRICEAIFFVVAELLPPSEIQFQSHILRCFTDPQLSLDKALLEEELVRVLAAKEASLQKVMELVNVGTREELVVQLMSNPKFAELLQRMGVEAPMKDSPTAVDEHGYPKRTFAFAKTDEGLLELAESDDEMVAAVVAARLGNKSTIQETRLRRMIGMADQPTLPVQLTISAAISHRLGGAGACNFMNMPSGRVKGQSNAMRRSIKAPAGTQCIAVDSSQIELRGGAYIANEQTALQVFREGKDPYSKMASKIYPAYTEDEINAGRKAGNEEMAMMRQVGKSAELSCIYGTSAGGFLGYCRTVAKVPMEDDLAKLVVGMWRDAHPHTVATWKNFQASMLDASTGGAGYMGGPDGKLFYYDGSRRLLGHRIPGIRLPDGNWLNFVGLSAEKGEKGWQLTYKKAFGKDKQVGNTLITERTWGSKIYQLCTQATAFAVMKEQMNTIGKRAQILLNVHDEAVFIAPDHAVSRAKQFAIESFSTTPLWLQGCPLGAEAGASRRYGDT
jgi:DNA polymerase family A